MVSTSFAGIYSGDEDLSKKEETSFDSEEVPEILPTEKETVFESGDIAGIVGRKDISFEREVLQSSVLYQLTMLIFILPATPKAVN